MTLVWGVRKDGTQEERNRARYLFQQLEAEQAQVIVPAVVVAEYLYPVDDSKKARVVAELTERFRVVPFDVRSAALAARLFAKAKPNAPQGIPGKRDCLKADSLIVASAASAGAKIFYSDDGNCRAMASGVLIARELPTGPQSLFQY
jgi:predicted nucleic acid-binding protein